MSRIHLAGISLVVVIPLAILTAIGFNTGLIRKVDDNELVTSWNTRTGVIQQLDKGLYVVPPVNRVTTYSPSADGQRVLFTKATVHIGNERSTMDVPVQFTIGFKDALAYVEDHSDGVVRDDRLFMDDVIAEIISDYSDRFMAGELPSIHYVYNREPLASIEASEAPCTTIETRFDPKRLVDQFIEQEGLGVYPSFTIDIPVAALVQYAAGPATSSTPACEGFPLD